MQYAWQTCYYSFLLQHNVSGCQLNKQGGFLDRWAFFVTVMIQKALGNDIP